MNASVEQGFDSLCVEACVHISESKLGQSVSKDPAMTQRTEEFRLRVCGAGRGRVRFRVMIRVRFRVGWLQVVK